MCRRSRIRRPGVAVFDGYGSGGWIVVRRHERSQPTRRRDARAHRPHLRRARLRVPQPQRLLRRRQRQERQLLERVELLLPRARGYDGPTGMGTPNGTSMLRGTHPVSSGGHDAGGCQSCTASSDCAHGEHCLEDTAHSSGKFCAPDCTADHASCPSGYSCADLNGTELGLPSRAGHLQLNQSAWKRPQYTIRSLPRGRRGRVGDGVSETVSSKSRRAGYE